ncbi:hypothetical protein Adt_36793 [Abeliophyllum distichum]|uniref:Uncharacterized protein n=1 Tax=Abeliophyllum distichum TaxID=126358 RepID=A0ABD1QIK6_9LAMI
MLNSNGESQLRRAALSPAHSIVWNLDPFIDHHFFYFERNQIPQFSRTRFSALNPLPLSSVAGEFVGCPSRDCPSCATALPSPLLFPSRLPFLRCATCPSFASDLPSLRDCPSLLEGRAAAKGRAEAKEGQSRSEGRAEKKEGQSREGQPTNSPATEDRGRGFRAENRVRENWGI